MKKFFFFLKLKELGFYTMIFFLFSSENVHAMEYLLEQLKNNQAFDVKYYSFDNAIEMVYKNRKKYPLLALSEKDTTLLNSLGWSECRGDRYNYWQYYYKYTNQCIHQNIKYYKNKYSLMSITHKYISKPFNMNECRDFPDSNVQHVMVIIREHGSKSNVDSRTRYLDLSCD